ncbi:restriction endonuclease subunit S [Sorangium sp. So ce216]
MVLDLPWPSARLGEIAQIQTGLAKGKQPVEGVPVPYLRVANVQDGYVDLTEIKTVIVEPQALQRYSLRDNDVLFTEGGDADKLGRGCVWKAQISPCIHQNHVFAVRASQDVLLPSFLAAYAAGPLGKSYFLSCAKQTTNLASINSTQLRNFPIPIPPIGEQRKIAAILSSVEDAIEATQAVIDQLQVVKKAMMAELLTRGLPGRHKRFKKTEIGEVPEEWEIARLSEVAQVQTGIAKGKTIEHGIELPYLRVANVQDGHVDLSEIKTIVIEERFVERYLLKPGDVLFTEGGDADKLGRGCVWHGQIDVCLHQNHVFAVRTETHRLLPEFLAHWAASPKGKAYFLDCAKQTTNLASINSTQLKAFPVPLPAIEEQTELMAAMGALESRLEAERDCSRRMQELKFALQSALLTGEIRVTPDEASP